MRVYAARPMYREIALKSQRIEAKNRYLRTPRNAQAREPYGARVKCEAKSEAFVHAVA